MGCHQEMALEFFSQSLGQGASIGGLWQHRTRRSADGSEPGFTIFNLAGSWSAQFTTPLAQKCIGPRGLSRRSAQWPVHPCPLVGNCESQSCRRQRGERVHNLPLITAAPNIVGNEVRQLCWWEMRWPVDVVGASRAAHICLVFLSSPPHPATCSTSSQAASV